MELDPADLIALADGSDCTAHFWNQSVPNATFDNLEEAVRNVAMLRDAVNPTEVHVHAPTPRIVAGSELEDLIAHYSALDAQQNRAVRLDLRNGKRPAEASP